MTLDEILPLINQFRDDRNWRQFHNPKNLAISLSLEANEILEYFQWTDLQESAQISKQKRQEIASEIADIGIYLLYLCDDLGIDLYQAISEKVQKNTLRFPIDKTYGTHKKPASEQ